MKSLSFFFLMIGIIFITVGYTESKCSNNSQKEIEYRYVPRTIYDEQISEGSVSEINSNIFNETDPKYRS